MFLPATTTKAFFFWVSAEEPAGCPPVGRIGSNQALEIAPEEVNCGAPQRELELDTALRGKRETLQKTCPGLISRTSLKKRIK